VSFDATRRIATSVRARRGACPTIAAPMPTGDGLLARLSPIATVGLDDFAALCRAARRFGNGIIEITARGNIQVRGLRPETVDAFAQSVAVEAIDDGGIAVLTDPLAGLAPEPAVDVATLAGKLRAELASQALADRLSPKVSVAIDGGTTLHLDGVAADIRLRGCGAGRFHVAVGGNAIDATTIGAVGGSNAVALVLRLLSVIATRGGTVRAKQIVQAEGIAVFAQAVRELVTSAPQLAPRANAQPIGQHALRDGSFAVGVGLAFGHVTADALEQLADAASDARACGVRTAPQRCLLVTGVAPAGTRVFVETAGRLGFVTAGADPRLRVAACAGAPLCGSGAIATRVLAPDVATAAGSLLDGSITIHLSGCPKGCAHAGAAALTIVGSARDACRIIWSGTTMDAAVAEVSQDDLPQRLARLAHEAASISMPGEGISAALARLGRARIAAALAGARP